MEEQRKLGKLRNMIFWSCETSNKVYIYKQQKELSARKSLNYSIAGIWVDGMM